MPYPQIETPKTKQLLIKNNVSNQQKQINAENQQKTQQNVIFTADTSFNLHLSLTQRQIMSHRLIYDVNQRSKRNTIQHKINKIPNDIRLFNVPLEYVNQFQFDVIPPKNNNYASSASKKIKQIHGRISDERNMSQRLIELAAKNMKNYIQSKNKNKKRPGSSGVNINNRVSVSGLVSYNFNSVNARRSLGSIPDVPQDKCLQMKVHETNKKLNKSRQRQTKIVNRKPTAYSLHRIQLSNAATSDFSMKTDQFLSNLIKQSNRSKKIYGDNFQKLECIKQYMEKQKADYGEAKYIVQAIISSKPKEQIKKQQKKEVKIDDQVQLSKRKRALSRKKVMLRQLYFTQC